MRSRLSDAFESCDDCCDTSSDGRSRLTDWIVYIALLAAFGWSVWHWKTRHETAVERSQNASKESLEWSR